MAKLLSLLVSPFDVTTTIVVVRAVVIAIAVVVVNFIINIIISNGVTAISAATVATGKGLLLLGSDTTLVSYTTHFVSYWPTTRHFLQSLHNHPISAHALGVLIKRKHVNYKQKR